MRKLYHRYRKSKNTKIYDFFEDIFIMQKFQNSTQSKTLEPLHPSLQRAGPTAKKMILKNEILAL